MATKASGVRTAARSRSVAKRSSRSPSKAAARATKKARAAKRTAGTSARALRRILVPLDGSRSSFAALRAALALACDLDATVVAYHALPSMPVPHFDAPAAGQPSPEEQRELLRQLAGRYFEKAERLAALTGVTLETMSDLRNDVADGIAEAAQRWDCDLILLGSHGRGAFRRLLMGSVATQLLSIATVPVLVLPLQAIGQRKPAEQRGG
jgi:nucleotide-binding universal stress UspA family protein